MPDDNAAAPFLSPPPEVALTGYFVRPYDNAVATARTCYSAKGIVTPEQVAGEHLSEPEKRERARQRRDHLARSIYEAGHHTTLQHAHFQFALTNVSRQFIWSFLHAHPFYNSEQVSQRYVPVQREHVLVPCLKGEALAIYERCVAQQMGAYRELCERLEPLARKHYLARFPGRAKERHAKQTAKDVEKRCMEVARYVLPVATFAYLYHTVSGLTLLRYHRLCRVLDVPRETAYVVERMMRAVLDLDPDYANLVEDPLPLEATPEYAALQELSERQQTTPESRKAFVERFDAQLGRHVSKLVAATPEAETLLAESVREVLGVLPAAMSDDEAVAAVLDPQGNRLLGESLNLSLHNKLMRAGLHVNYTFRKKLSHTADSQDQRHRMTPGSRPVLMAHVFDEPDTVEPAMILEAEAEGGALAELGRVYRDSLARTYEAVAALRKHGVSEEQASYLLPNAQAIRFTETGDVLAMRHKLQMRLCFNAQEEIFRASLDEAKQVAATHPRIGRYLLPPCTLRSQAGVRPVCPEGNRFCGIKVWRHETDEYEALRGTL